nr:glycine cleavage T C-terminal barrel domain-containing protein [Pseudophaeobacter leonis]
MPRGKLVGIKPEGAARQHGKGLRCKTWPVRPSAAFTSGGFGPTVGAPVAMGYVTAGHATPGEKVNLIIRGKAQPADVVALPFVTQN